MMRRCWSGKLMMLPKTCFSRAKPLSLPISKISVNLNIHSNSSTFLID